MNTIRNSAKQFPESLLNPVTVNMYRVAQLDMKDDKIEFNNGVIEYFKNFQSQITGVQHYIVTSGIKDYVDKTVIRKFVDGVYGVTFNEENGIYKNIDKNMKLGGGYNFSGFKDSLGEQDYKTSGWFLNIIGTM